MAPIGTVVQGNYIGTDITGTLARGNYIGIDIEGASSSLIGTDGQDGAADAAEGNLISGNLMSGIMINAAPEFVGGSPTIPGAASNVVAGNRIGTNAAGTAALGNGNDGDGIDLIGGTSHNSIGVNTVYGPANADQRNLISGNTVGFDAGVYIDPTSSHNTIAGNLIGTSLGGTSPLANDYGVYIQGPLNVVGTTGQDGSADALESNVISGNNADGVILTGPQASDNVVAGNLIGTNTAGTAGLANVGDGVHVANQAVNNWIGFNSFYGPGNSDERNIISGNSGFGVELSGIGTSGNTVAGNFAGLDITGNVSVPNRLAGLGIHQGATSNTIGGTAAAARNVFSGNHASGNDRGILVTDAGTSFNLIIGNYVGTNAGGTAAVTNDNSGILVSGSASGNTIGGTLAGARNLISGNTLAGIAFDGTGTTGNVAIGNWVGINAAGTGSIANLGGIGFIDGSSGNSALDNVVSGNTLSGISIINYDTSQGSNGNLVQGNLIGTDPSGLVALGNAGPGVVIYGGSSNNTIGGGAAALRNIISANSGAGISISGTGTAGNLVLGNDIGTNGTGAVALGNSGTGVTIAAGASGNTIGGTAAAVQQSVLASTGLDNPYRIVRAANGDLYFDDLDNDIYKVDHTTGQLSLFSSGGLLTASEAMTLDFTKDALIVSNYDNNTNTSNLVRVSLSDGTQSLVSSGQFLKEADDIAVAPDGSYAVTNFDFQTESSQVVRVDSNTGVQSLITPAPVPLEFDGIAVSPLGTIYVTADNLQTGPSAVAELLRIDPSTGASSVIVSRPQEFFDGLTVLPRGWLVVADQVLTSGPSAPAGQLLEINPATGGAIDHLQRRRADRDGRRGGRAERRPACAQRSDRPAEPQCDRAGAGEPREKHHFGQHGGRRAYHGHRDEQ